MNNQKSPMEQAIDQAVGVRIAAYHVSFLRRNGGVPVNQSGENFQKAVSYTNKVLSESMKKGAKTVIDGKMASNALDLLGVLNAQSHDSPEALKKTLALFTTLASMPEAEQGGKVPVVNEESEQS